MDEPSRTVNPASARSQRAQTSKGLGKRPYEFKHYYKTQRNAQIIHAIILTDSMNLLQKVESEVRWHTAMRSLRLQRLLPVYRHGHAGVGGNERADRLASTAHFTSGSSLGRAEVLRTLRELSEHGQARAPQHRSAKGKRSGERKRPTFHPPRSGTISVQPDKHWQCFEGNIGKTAERQGGARMGLSERYDVILNRN